MEKKDGASPIPQYAPARWALRARLSDSWRHWPLTPAMMTTFWNPAASSFCLTVLMTFSFSSSVRQALSRQLADTD